MSEELKPCPCGGATYVGEYRFTGETKWGVGCMRCNRGPIMRHSKDAAVRAWNASPTPPTTEGREDIVARLRNDGSSWAQDLFNEAAAEIERLRLLSSPRVEDVRREAWKEAARIAGRW